MICWSVLNNYYPHCVVFCYQLIKIIISMHKSFFYLILTLISSSGFAGELGFYGLSLSGGGGKQPDTDDRNQMKAIELDFYKHQRSPRQHISVFAVLAQLDSNADTGREINAYSIVPQVSFFLPINKNMQLQLLLRALGLTYMSGNELGTRQQAEHFTFQSMVGAGLQFGSERQYELNLAWRHYSNANLFKDNDGWDFPVTLQFVFKVKP